MKKLLAWILTLAMLCALPLPVLAAEDPDDTLSWSEDVDQEDDYEESEYEKGYWDAFNLAWDKGYAQGQEDGKAKVLNLPEDHEYAEGDTYAEGQTDGALDGYASGYAKGFYSVLSIDPWSAQELLKRGGVLNEVNVMYNGQVLSFPDVLPKLVGGRTMLPVRTVMEAMDAQVDYDDAAGRVSVTMEDTTVTFSVGSDTVTVEKDGQATTVQMDCATYETYANGAYRTMVPVRFLSEACGYTVLWDDDYRTAVVVDDQALAEKIDAGFTRINDLIRKQTEAQAGKKLVETTQATGKLTLYDEEGTPADYTISAQATTYTDGAALRLELSLDIEDALKNLVKHYPELIGEVQVSLKAALQTDLKNIPLTLLVDETGACYLNMPLLNALFPEGFPSENAWYQVADLAEAMPQAGGFTVGELLTQTLAEDWDGFHYYDNVTEAAQVLELLLGDQSAEQTGSSATWTMTTEKLAGLMELMPEELDGFDLTGSLRLDDRGSCAMKGQMTLDGLGDGSQTFTGSLDLTGDTSSSKLTLALGLKSPDAPGEQFDLSLSCTQRVKTAATLPAFTLPQGAEVVDMT